MNFFNCDESESDEKEIIDNTDLSYTYSIKQPIDSFFNTDQKCSNQQNVTDINKILIKPETYQQMSAAMNIIENRNVIIQPTKELSEKTSSQQSIYPMQQTTQMPQQVIDDLFYPKNQQKFNIIKKDEKLQTANQIFQNHIHTIEGKAYMDVDFIIKNPAFAADIAGQYREQFKSETQNNNKKIEPGLEFHWTKEYSNIFAIACMAFGITKVTPKQLQQVLPFEISRESVGSHLQKYRIKLLKQYSLQSSSEIRNYHFPKDIEDEKLEVLKQMWESGFPGYTIEQVKQFLLE